MPMSMFLTFMVFEFLGQHNYEILNTRQLKHACILSTGTRKYYPPPHLYRNLYLVFVLNPSGSTKTIDSMARDNYIFCKQKLILEIHQSKQKTPRNFPFIFFYNVNEKMVAIKVTFLRGIAN